MPPLTLFLRSPPKSYIDGEVGENVRKRCFVCSPKINSSYAIGSEPLDPLKIRETLVQKTVCFRQF